MCVSGCIYIYKSVYTYRHRKTTDNPVRYVEIYNQKQYNTYNNTY